MLYSYIVPLEVYVVVYKTSIVFRETKALLSSPPVPYMLVTVYVRFCLHRYLFVDRPLLNVTEAIGSERANGTAGPSME